VSDAYNKQFKFVVLADEWLYVTENPPKVAKDIQEVTRIVDITSVELVSVSSMENSKVLLTT
jgi:hypothetical protein